MYKAEYYPSSPTDTCSLSGSLPEMYASSYCSSSSSAPSTPEPEPEPIKVKKTSPKKQYQCTHCLKNFSRPSALQTHTYTHTAEKPFQCTKSGCGRKFSVVSNLRRHLKVHQKPSVGNKLSSEDRLRYVQQLIKTSEIILAKRQQEEELAAAAAAAAVAAAAATRNEILLDGRSNIENEGGYRHPSLETHRYQHYLLLPSLVDNNNNGTPSNLAGAEPYSWNNVVQDTRTPDFASYHSSYSNNSSLYPAWNYYQS